GRERDVDQQSTHLRRVVVLDRRLEVLAGRRGLLELAAKPAQQADLSCTGGHSGRRTVRLSPSSSTEPPSARTARTATAAPRSRSSSPSSTGPAEGVTGEVLTVPPTPRTPPRA